MEFVFPIQTAKCFNFYLNNNPTSGTVASVIGGTENLITSSSLESNQGGATETELVHGIGHNLSLYHTYEVGAHYPDPNNNLLCERVNRVVDLNPAIYNANLAGDEVEDTPSQPLLQNYMFSFNPPSCAYYYDSGLQNCYNEIYGNPVNGIINQNFMSGLYFASCDEMTFSAGQIQRMRKFIQYNTLNYNESYIPSVKNTVESLFQPYSRKYIEGAIIQTTDNGNGYCQGLS